MWANVVLNENSHWYHMNVANSMACMWKNIHKCPRVEWLLFAYGLQVMYNNWLT